MTPDKERVYFFPVSRGPPALRVQEVGSNSVHLCSCLTYRYSLLACFNTSHPEEVGTPSLVGLSQGGSLEGFGGPYLPPDLKGKLDLPRRKFLTPSELMPGRC